QGRPALPAGRGARPRHVPRGLPARAAAPLRRPPPPRDHRLRPPPQCPHGAPVPDRRLEELRQAPLREATRPHHPRDAPRPDRRALALAEGLGPTALPGKGAPATLMARPL